MNRRGHSSSCQILYSRVGRISCLWMVRIFSPWNQFKVRVLRVHRCRRRQQHPRPLLYWTLFNHLTRAIMCQCWRVRSFFRRRCQTNPTFLGLNYILEQISRVAIEWSNIFAKWLSGLRIGHPIQQIRMKVCSSNRLALSADGLQAKTGTKTS